MVRTAAEKDTESFEAAYRRAKALRTIMQMTDDTSNRDHRQPGVKCGTKRLLPRIRFAFLKLPAINNAISLARYLDILI